MDAVLKIAFAYRHCSKVSYHVHEYVGQTYFHAMASVLVIAPLFSKCNCISIKINMLQFRNKGYIFTNNNSSRRCDFCNRDIYEN